MKDTWTTYVSVVIPFLQNLKIHNPEVRKMDVKNYNRNRKKPVGKKLRIVAFLLLFIGVVLAVFPIL